MCLQVLVKYAGQSYRLLALAVGLLEGVTAAELAKLDQQHAEALCGPLHFLGLQLLSNHLRPSSRETILNLQDRCPLHSLQVWHVCSTCQDWWSQSHQQDRCVCSKRNIGVHAQSARPV